MKSFLKASFYLFHPLWIPFLGTLIFFTISPKEFSPETIKRKLIGVIILSILTPFALLFALRRLNDYPFLEWKNIRVRQFYLLFLCLVLITINNFLIPPLQFLELSYFFTGLLLTFSLALLFSYLRLIISLHTASLSSLLSFLFSLSMLYQLNLLYLIIPLIFIIGWVASERLYGDDHTYAEIFISFLLGLFPQFILAFGVFQHYRI